MNRKHKPKPAAALPRANKFNQVVSMDLKHYEDSPYKYILYLVDLFSRFMVAGLIKNKQPSTVGAFVLEKWG